MAIKTLLLHHDKDKDVADHMRGQLAVDIRNKVVEFLEPLKAGEPLENMLQRIRDSKLILYLISMDAMSDPKLGDELLNEVMGLAKTGQLYLVPIYVRSFYWQDTDFKHFFEKNQPKPISGYNPIDDGCLEVVMQLKKLFANFDKQLGALKPTLEQQRNLLKGFNYRDQINEEAKKKVLEVKNWCRICLLQGEAQSGFNILGWRIRTELAGVPREEDTTFRAVNLDDLGEWQRDDLEAYKNLFCTEILGASSMDDLAKQMRQHLQTQHFVLYVQNLLPINVHHVASFFSALHNAWAASGSNESLPKYAMWCFLTYTGDGDIEVPVPAEIKHISFSAVKHFEASEFDEWIGCCALDPRKKTELIQSKDYIVEATPDNNQVIPVLSRLCEKMTYSSLMYEEFVLKIDKGLTL